MSIKKDGFVWTTLVYWCAVAGLLLLCFFFTGNAPQCGGGGGEGIGNGSGCGYADSGSGDGAGSGNGASRTGTGSGDGESAVGNADPAAPAAPVAPAVPPPAAGQGNAKRNGQGNVAAHPDPAPEAPDDVVPQKARPFEFKSDSGAATSTSSGGREKGFFGVEVVKGGRVIFLVDVSSSMGSGTDEGISRIELLKRELQKVITNMSKSPSSDNTAPSKSLLTSSGGTFRIACFSCSCSVTPQAGQKSWSFGKKTDVATALHFVSTLSAGGGTNMMDGWRTIEKCIASDRITTVYFLSDGDPTDCNEASLLDYLQKKFPRLIIHTFSMGQESHLMESVAAQHRGKYRSVK